VRKQALLTKFILNNVSMQETRLFRVCSGCIQILISADPVPASVMASCVRLSLEGGVYHLISLH
jgi:hypothetical protein